jgi:hypothetical protein
MRLRHCAIADSIVDVLRDVLPTTGVILEIASGSGEHVLHFAQFPKLVLVEGVAAHFGWRLIPLGMLWLCWREMPARATSASIGPAEGRGKTGKIPVLVHPCAAAPSTIRAGTRLVSASIVAIPIAVVRAATSASMRPVSWQLSSVVARRSEPSVGASSAGSSSSPALRTSKTSAGEMNLDKSRCQPLVSAR